MASAVGKRAQQAVGAEDQVAELAYSVAVDGSGVGGLVAGVGGKREAIGSALPVGEGALVASVDADLAAQEAHGHTLAADIAHAIEGRGHAPQGQMAALENEADERTQGGIVPFV